MGERERRANREERWGKGGMKRQEEREEIETFWNRGKGRQTLEGFLSGRKSES